MRERNFVYLTLLFGLIWSCKPASREQIETDFKIERPERIAFIEIYHQGKLEHSLSKTLEGWKLNQKYKVRPDAMDNILRILPDLKVLYYPPAAAWENMVRAIQEEGVRMVFKDASGKKIKSFSIGGTTNDERGTYAILEGASKPYVVHVPGFNGSLVNRFRMSDDEWRDRMIFNEKKEDLVQFRIQYPGEPLSGFELTKKENRWVLNNLNHEVIRANESLLLSYLDGFSGIGAEGIENDYRYIPQVLQSTPHAIITWTTLDGSSRTIKFYPVELDGRTGIERFYVYDGEDFFLAQTRILQKIFRSIDSF